MNKCHDAAIVFTAIGMNNEFQTPRANSLDYKITEACSEYTQITYMTVYISLIVYFDKPSEF